MEPQSPQQPSHTSKHCILQPVTSIRTIITSACTSSKMAFLFSPSFRMLFALIATCAVTFISMIWMSTRTMIFSTSVVLRKRDESYALKSKRDVDVVVNRSSSPELPYHGTEYADILHPPENQNSQCYLVDVRDSPAADTDYPFNARSFCLTSSMCIQTFSDEQTKPTLYFSAFPGSTQCNNVTIAFKEKTLHSNCNQLQSSVHCAHGRFNAPDDLTCPKIGVISDVPSHILQRSQWLPGIVVVVPEFPHLQNIFHFSFVLGTVSHLLPALPFLWSKFVPRSQHSSKPLPVTLLFQGRHPKKEGKWQSELLQAVIDSRLSHAKLKVSVGSLKDSPYNQSSQLVCARSSVLLGDRSNINTWPFPSTQYPNVSGNQVTVEAVAFRHAVYTAMGLNTRLPPLIYGALSTVHKNYLFDLPPLAIGYARRNFYPDFSDGEPQLGTKRRFSDIDDAWFEAMLREEATLANTTMVTLQISKNTPVREQVTMFSKIGFVGGIHGANLMNTIFMKPFSAMLEIFSAKSLQCYVAGANSGLAYLKYSPTKRASGEESGCTEEHPTCWSYLHNRRVLISDEKDRAALRSLVKQGVKHVLSLHKHFGQLGGVPVQYNEKLAHFAIDWQRSRLKPVG